MLNEEKNNPEAEEGKQEDLSAELEDKTGQKPDTTDNLKDPEVGESELESEDFENSEPLTVKIKSFSKIFLKYLGMAGAFLLAVCVITVQKTKKLVLKLYKKLPEKYRIFSRTDEDDTEKSTRTGAKVVAKKKRRGIFSGLSDKDYARVWAITGFSAIALIAVVIIFVSISKPKPPVMIIDTQPSSQAEPQDLKATLTFGGSIALNQSLLDSCKTSIGDYEIYDALKYTASSFSSDLNLVSVLGAVNDTSKQTAPFPNANYPVNLVRALSSIHVNSVALASDHSFDMGFSGIVSTIDTFESQSILPVGIYKDMVSHDSLLIREVNGVKIGFINYSGIYDDNYVNLTKDQKEFGLKHFNIDNPEEAAQTMLAEVKALEGAGAQFIVALIRWGQTEATEPTAQMRSIADKLACNGVDIILGYGSQFPQRITYKEFKQPDETNKPVLIMYDLGNFYADNSEVSIKGSSSPNESLLVNVEITLAAGKERASLTDTSYTPMFVSKADDSQGRDSRAKFIVIPSNKYASTDERPDIFAVNAQWAAVQSSFNRMQSRVTSWCGDKIRIAAVNEEDLSSSEKPPELKNV